MSQVSTDAYENARELIKRILNVPSDYELVFTANTTDGINKLSLSFDFSDKIVAISDIEHSANYLPWLQRSKRLIKIKMDAHYKIDLDHLREMVKKHRPFIFSTALSSNISGVSLSQKEIDQIREIFHEFGTIFILDAAQSVAHKKIDVKQLQCDAIVFAGHKMYAPLGAGALIAKRDILKHRFNSITGGGNVDYIDENDSVFYKELSHGSETGAPNEVGAIALAESFKTLYEHIDMDKAEEHGKRHKSY